MKAKKTKKRPIRRTYKQVFEHLHEAGLIEPTPKLSEKLGILTGITVVRDDRLPQPLLGEVQSLLRGFNHTPKDNYWKVKV